MSSTLSPAALAAVVLAATLAGCHKSSPAPEAAAAPPTATPGPIPAGAGDDTAAAKVFEDRIQPIFKSPDASSCARCHLASVDIKDYILPSAKDTFLALRDQGLIDLDKPDQSTILKLINRGADDPKAAGLISAKKQKAEYEAFAAWIKACAADPSLKNAPKPEKAPALATKPVEVVRHARKDQMFFSNDSNIRSFRAWRTTSAGLVASGLGLGRVPQRRIGGARLDPRRERLVLGLLLL